jgi:hypothetical protein
MSQFAALIWLKWTLFRNAMRSRKAVLSKVASVFGMFIALGVALLIALSLGLGVYKILSPETSGEILAQLPPDHPLVAEAHGILQSGFILLFMIFALLYLMWATVPLSLGGGSQFTPGRLLLYPISLKKLFALDFLSELTSIGTIFAIPIILATSFGAGAAIGNVLMALFAGLLAIACGISIAKWLSTSMGALMQKRRTRGETVLALIGVVVALGGAFLGELAPYLMRHMDTLRRLRWTPPGAAAMALTEGLSAGGWKVYATSILTLIAYTAGFVVVTYLIARHAALGMGGAKRGLTRARAQTTVSSTGWQLPLLSQQVSAVFEKELRYAMRNAQLRMMALMPLILVGIRFVRGGNRLASANVSSNAMASFNSFAAYADGLLAAGGVLYIFLILSSLICNSFAYEAGGMRAYILAPVDRRTILVGKNLAIAFLAFLFSAVLLTVNQIVFRDLSISSLSFAALSFIFFAACFAMIGNWLSILFPKRLQFGKRMNASGVTGFLLIPILLVLAAAPILAVTAGYYARSFTLKYATLSMFAAASAALYFLLIKNQGRSLARHEQEILEAVGGKTED